MSAVQTVTDEKPLYIAGERASSNARWAMGRREWIAAVAGILLFAVLSWLTNYAKLADAFGADIRPAVAIPILFGFIYGPSVGFLTGLFGNLLFDFLVGNIPSPYGTPTGNLLTDAVTIYYINWQIANGLSGLIPGLLATVRKRYRSLTDMLIAVAVMAVGIAIGIGFAAATDPFFYPDMTLSRSFSEQFVPIFGHNLLSAFLFVPLLLFNYERLDLSYFRSGQWLRSGLLRKNITAIFVSAAIPTILLSFFLIQQERTVQDLQQENAALQAFTTTGQVQGDDGALASAQAEQPDNSSLYVKLLVTIGVTLLFTTTNSILATESVSRTLLRLTDSASRMQAGNLSLEQATSLKSTVGDDEISQLTRIFGEMAAEVLAREAALKEQVESLKIEVDLVKQQRQVTEITDSDFFKDLQSKAKHLRTRDAQLTGQLRIADLGQPAPETEETHPPGLLDKALAEEDSGAST